MNAFMTILLQCPYELLPSAPADRAFPISQSYVDIIMRGCLSISIDFARRFIETTHGWEHGEWLDQNERGSIEDDEENANNRDDRQPSSTSHHYVWVNDRHAPLYPRADLEYSLVKGKEVDALIHEHRPHALKLRILSDGQGWQHSTMDIVYK